MKARVVLFGMVMVLLACTFFSSSKASADTLSEASAIRVEQIEALYAERDRLRMEAYLSTNNEEFQECVNQIGIVDAQLVNLGVHFFSGEELKAFLEEKCPQEMREGGNLRIEIFDSDINDWSDYRYIYERNGVYYNIQKVIVSPKAGNTTSPLAINSQQTGSFSNSTWVAGNTSIMSTMAIDHNFSVIQYSSYSRTIYDAVHSVAPYITTTTEVGIPSIQYRIYGSETIFFFYVRLQNETDDYQKMTLETNHTTTTAKYSFTSMKYKSGNTWINVGIGADNPIEGTIALSVFPSEYASWSVAVDAYPYVAGVPFYRIVNSIMLKGPNNGVNCSCSPYIPPYPLACEYGDLGPLE